MVVAKLSRDGYVLNARSFAGTLLGRSSPRQRPDLIFLRVRGPAEGGDRQEVAGPLEPSPRVTLVPRVARHGGHRQRMQRLQFASGLSTSAFPRPVV